MTIVRSLLGAALVTAIFFSGWRVYRALPQTPAEQAETNEAAAKSKLTILFRNEVAIAPGATKIELYPLDFAAAQRDFLSNPRPGTTLDEFIAQRMKGVQPVQAQMDARGRAVTRLSDGKWWMRATAALANGETLEWRLPIVMSGRAQTFELSVDNAFERTKKF